MKNLTELGRSMVEMLGVLAIIGVLSIVGIQGYKKAMNKMKANELIDMGLKVYHAALAQRLANPSKDILCSNGFPSNITQTDYVVSSCNGNSRGTNLGMDKPSWATLDTFTVRVYLNPTSTYHLLGFYGVGSEDVCNEIKSRLIPTGGGYYQIPGTTGDIEAANSKGLTVTCYQGSETNTNDGKVFGP